MSVPVVVIVCLVIVLAAWGLSRLTRRPDAPAPHGPATMKSESDIRLLVERGDKITAIKLLRESRNIGLKEAKEAVDALERAGVLPPLGADASIRVLTPEAVAEIRTLATAGRQIDAIKRYREITGADLKESKDAVEALTATR
jgi:ribosomal protein L7/L12